MDVFDFPDDETNGRHSERQMQTMLLQWC